jgi:signal transduction histidine kinase
MIFLVQDILDFAQIKSGKFRKNYKKFDIRESVKKIMSIQEKKAKDKGIKLIAEFVNFSNDLDLNSNPISF